MKKLSLMLVPFILFGGIILSTFNKPQVNEVKTFGESIEEVQNFFEDVVGRPVNTPIISTLNWHTDPRLSNILAYCWLQPGNKYITFNYGLIQQVVKETGNSDLIFQVILHEYTHCEANMGHVQMYGHFMNDGGAPWLNKKDVKNQFKQFVKYYFKFYRNYFREEEDLTNMYALTIERDANGKIKTKCTCNMCTNNIG